LESIIGVHRNHFGEVMSFVTSSGRVISYQKALVETDAGLIGGIHKQEGPNGDIVLLPDEAVNFDHLPNLF